MTTPTTKSTAHPLVRELTLNLALLAGARIHLSWFDPRSGEWTEGGIVDAGPAVAVFPPAEHDWLLAMTPVES